MFKLKEVAIHLGNVCNLTCDQCLTLSNYNFRGWFSWKEHEEYYKRWGEILTIDTLALLGGEPYLNLDLLEWAKNLKQIWPNSYLYVETNGTLLHLEKNVKISRSLLDLGVMIRISCHDLKDYENILNSVKNILSYKKNIHTLEYRDKNLATLEFYETDKKLVQLVECNYFFKNYVKEVKNKVIHLYRSDAIENHSHCVINDCFTFLKGKLYKCPLVYTFAEAKSQFQFDTYTSNLLNLYEPCSPFDRIDSIEKFIMELDKVIPQCELCNFRSLKNKENIFPIKMDKKQKKQL